MGNEGSKGEESGLFPDKDEFENQTFSTLTRGLDDKQAKEAYQGDPDVVEDIERRLIENFRTTFRLYIMYRYLPVMVGAVALGYLVDRFNQPVPLASYGIVSVLIGVFILAQNTTTGRFMIAIETTPDVEEKREALARQTTRTAAGLFAFLVGFGVQLFAASEFFAVLFLGGLFVASLPGLRDVL